MLIVFGSINLDLAFRAPRLPASGETVLGTGYVISPGGKGANQAHAARLFGAETQLYGAVGGDEFAEFALALLEQAGVDLSGVQKLSGQTGCAAISVDDAGHNQIVVAPGVNLEARQSSVSDAALARAKAILLQMEVSPRENWTLVGRARQQGCRTLLSNAPAGPIPREILSALDILIVNQGEFAQTAQSIGLSGLGPDDMLRELAGEFALTVVLTLGDRGAVCCGNGMLTQCGAAKVAATDTTGAGDTFAGVLAAALVEGRPLDEALGFATVAAGLACTRPGAQAAQPSRSEIDAAMPDYLRSVADSAASGA